MEAADGGLFWQRDDCGSLQAGWDGGMRQGQVEDLCEDPSQLVCTLF